jgi:hypothetical protein
MLQSRLRLSKCPLNCKGFQLKCTFIYLSIVYVYLLHAPNHITFQDVSTLIISGQEHKL